MSDGGTDARKAQSLTAMREAQEKALPGFIEGLCASVQDVRNSLLNYWDARERLLMTNPDDKLCQVTRMEALIEDKPELIKKLRQLADDLEKKF